MFSFFLKTSFQIRNFEKKSEPYLLAISSNIDDNTDLIDKFDKKSNTRNDRNSNLNLNNAEEVVDITKVKYKNQNTRVGRGYSKKRPS